MGNRKSSNSAPPSPSQKITKLPSSVTKQIHISTNHPDGFHFTGENLNGTIKIPLSFLHCHFNDTSNQVTRAELLHKQLMNNPIIIELVGDATYSAEVDAAADSDGHVTHNVNLCRQCSIVIIDQYNAEWETITIPSSSLGTRSLSVVSPATVNGTFQLRIPDDLPPSLSNNRAPSVVYTLELSLSSNRSRYQIPITLSPRGCIPNPMVNTDFSNSTMNKNAIQLYARLSRNFYRPGEQISVTISYSNPQQRFIRSIIVRLIQFYRIHNDENRSILDGKEWIFDISTMLPQRQWIGDVCLQLPEQPLQASYSLRCVGTTQTIECELDYRILIHLSEKRGDDIYMTLSPIQVTYEK